MVLTLTQSLLDSLAKKYSHLLINKIPVYGSPFLRQETVIEDYEEKSILNVFNVEKYSYGNVYPLHCEGVLSVDDWTKLQNDFRVLLHAPRLELSYREEDNRYLVIDHSNDIFATNNLRFSPNEIDKLFFNPFILRCVNHFGGVDGFCPTIGVDRYGNSVCLTRPDHILITASTRGGKTVLAQQLILQFLLYQQYGFCSVHIIDRKKALGRMLSNEKSNLYGISNVPVVLEDFSPESILNYFELLEHEMYCRQEILADAGESEMIHFDSEKKERRLLFLVVDEWAHTINSLSTDSSTKKIADLIKQKVYTLTAVGASAGIMTCWLAQRGDAEYFGGPTRANFLTRIAFRLPTDADYYLIFDREDLESIDLSYIKNQPNQGIGIAKIAGEPVQIFKSLSPDISQTFTDEFGNNYRFNNLYDYYLAKSYLVNSKCSDEKLFYQKFGNATLN